MKLDDSQTAMMRALADGIRDHDRRAAAGEEQAEIRYGPFTLDVRGRLHVERQSSGWTGATIRYGDATIEGKVTSCTHYLGRVLDVSASTMPGHAAEIRALKVIYSRAMEVAFVRARIKAAGIFAEGWQRRQMR